jgi:hypothetical protein
MAAQVVLLRTISSSYGNLESIRPLIHTIKYFTTIIENKFKILCRLIINYDEIIMSDYDNFLKIKREIRKMYNDINGDPKYTEETFLCFLTLLSIIFCVEPIETIRTRRYPEDVSSDFTDTVENNTRHLKLIFSLYIQLYENGRDLSELPNIDKQILDRIQYRNREHFTCPSNSSSCTIANKYYHYNKYLKYKNKYNKLKQILNNP